MRSIPFVALASSALLSSCICSRSFGFVDENSVEVDRYAGHAQRAWSEGQTLVIEIDQIAGLNVATIDHEVRDGALYLQPIRISSGSHGAQEFRIELAKFGFAADWREHVYWVTQDSCQLFLAKDTSMRATRVKLEVLASRPLE